jgi:hypothetical protein
MTIRSSNEAVRKAPKVATLELHREALRELTESEAEDVAGGRGKFGSNLPSADLHISCNGFTCWPRCRPSVDVRCTTKCKSSV